MRVTGGAFKGRRLRTTRAPSMRPTTDTARRTLFDILADRVVDADVLDLFAGAGTLGIEALSRGARAVTFVDTDRAACAAIEHNVELTGTSAAAAIRRSDVPKMLAAGAQTPFDLVFLDPPYERGLRFVARVLQALLEGGWVRFGGTVVVEAEAGDLALPVGLSEIRARRFGRTQFVIAERHGDQARSDLPGDV